MESDNEFIIKMLKVQMDHNRIMHDRISLLREEVLRLSDAMKLSMEGVLEFAQDLKNLLEKSSYETK